MGSSIGQAYRGVEARCSLSEAWLLLNSAFARIRWKVHSANADSKAPSAHDTDEEDMAELFCMPALSSEVLEIRFMRERRLSLMMRLGS